MGTDIHSIAQYKLRDYWSTVRGRTCGDHRNYDTFAILADVRNGVGFAGIKTGERWPVITEPRGLPEGLETKDENFTSCPTCHDGTLWLGDHSFSWVTLKEMRAMEKVLDKKGVYLEIGTVEREVFLKVKATGEEPTEWSGGVSGPGLMTVDESEFDYTDPRVTHVRMSWHRSWRKCAWLFVNYLEELSRIEKFYGIEDDQNVRLVFGFDS